MFEEREVFSLLLGVCGLGFVLMARRRIRSLPHFGLLLASYASLLASWFFSVAEGVAWEIHLNRLQHVCSGVGSLLLALWSVRLLRKPASREEAAGES